MRRTCRIASLTLLMLLGLTNVTQAATADQIHRDAADGSIDGSYTLSEMRAADRSVSAEQREYFGWEDVYAAYIRSLANPNDIPAAVPVDTDKDGKIEPEERAAAKAKTKAKCKAAKAAARRSKTCKAVGTEGAGTAPDDAEPRDDDNEPASDEDENGTSPLLWLIVGIPILVVALGAWRMRGRGKGDPNP